MVYDVKTKQLTNKKFVRSVYPTAICIYICDTFADAIYLIKYKMDNLGRGNPIDWGSSPKNAWKNSAEKIKQDMLRKLES
jgi:hypothetical protein